MTLRRAVDELVIEELLIRRHGSGTYTSRPKVARCLGRILPPNRAVRHVPSEHTPESG
ncbi:hypothetical protein [Kribbella sp. NBC_01484]|uniref:hypothetical protein n=1 Tax=Kribbella sp. NBC_01484 TaxID=2903579 RepID=UPI003FA5E456